MKNFTAELIEAIDNALLNDPFHVYTVEQVNDRIEISYLNGSYVLGTIEQDNDSVYFDNDVFDRDVEEIDSIANIVFETIVQ